MPAQGSESMPSESTRTPMPRSLSGAIYSASQIHGLIRLLSDDDPRILQTVRQHLRWAFPGVRPYLEDALQAADDPRVREEISGLLLDSLREEKLEEWEVFCQRPDLDLEEGSLLLAAVEFPLDSFQGCRKTLDDCGVVLRKRLPPTASADTIVGRLCHLLFREMGLQGNRENYYDPDNSYLHRVLERRLGIPISLSVVAMLVARRVGFEIDGIGLPGHFLLRYRDGRRETFFDPFHGGRVWTLEDCLLYLRGEGYGFREEYLKSLNVRDILIRSLANLLNIFRTRDDEPRLQRVTRMLEALR